MSDQEMDINDAEKSAILTPCTVQFLYAFSHLKDHVNGSFLIFILTDILFSTTLVISGGN